MLVSEIGEFGLIELLSREFGIEYPPVPGAAQAGLAVGLGDDALVTERQDAALIWTTDTMVTGVHFLPERSGWRDVGWRALASNVSDIAAMGGSPDVALVTLCLPEDFRVDDALAFYRGLHECCDVFKVTLGGGDVVRSPVFTVTVALSGVAELDAKGKPAVLTRAAARPGDVVAVSGTPGDAAGGVRLALGASAFETSAEQRLREASQRPLPRPALGLEAVRTGLRCGIDVSDGLVQDLGHIARASRVGIRMEAARVPVSQALQEVFPAEAMGLALSGGEDYELVIIGPRAMVESLLETSGTPLTEVGEVYPSDTPEVHVIDETGREIPLAKSGWDHFKTA